MGNICPWCCKNLDDSQSNNNRNSDSAVTTTFTSSEVNDRTPFVIKEFQTSSFPRFIFFISLLGGHSRNRHSIPVNDQYAATNTEQSSLSPSILPPPSPLLTETNADSTSKLSDFLSQLKKCSLEQN